MELDNRLAIIKIKRFTHGDWTETGYDKDEKVY